MGGKGVGAKIRRLNKGKKPHEPVFDPDELPEGSIIAVDISTMLVPFVKSDEGASVPSPGVMTSPGGLGPATWPFPRTDQILSHHISRKNR